MLSFHPCEITNRSVIGLAAVGATAARTAWIWSGLKTSPSFVNSTGRYGNGPIVVGDGIIGISLNGLNGAHQVDESGALEIAFAPKVGGRRHEDLLHLLV